MKVWMNLCTEQLQISSWGSREQMRRLAFDNQDVNFNLGADNSHIIKKKGIEEWAKDTYDYIARKLGEENILIFVYF